MTSKLKKVKSSGRFGARYGKKVRENLSLIESKQRKKQKCPFCGKKGVKRISKGVWLCTRKKCGKKFAAETYYLG
ncbi:MAG: 50S ribosomal protein L37ae [Candidatus Pacearchaeota archaeon]